jgi:ADP-heptose:LPS heptosyltransferase
MPRRQRWRPVRGTGSRVYDWRERLALGLLDLPGRVAAALGRGLGLARVSPAIDPQSLLEVLVLRLDRIGDVLMALPALEDLRQALPRARIRLALGRWSAELARSAPVDEVLVWSAPWVGRAAEGADSARELWRKARGAARPDLALDLQGDVRSSFLMWLTRAPLRVGYANTGGGYLLTHVVPLDETVSWVEQNRRAVALVAGALPGRAPASILSAEERGGAAALLAGLGLEGRRPLIAIHPSGGRRIKQWELARWAVVAARLQRDFGAAVLFTGSQADRPLVAAACQGLAEPGIDLSGRLSVRETLALIAAVDLFLSCDTGPMHMACAVGTPSVSVFGPSDPARYFSGPDLGPPGSRHRVVRRELWCSPCNLIRRPPVECAAAQVPECLDLVSADDVFAAAAELLGTAKDTAPRPG